MQWWIYLGRITTPVVLPETGPTIIRPRMKFQAPQRAVAHLQKLGLVRPIKEPVDTEERPAGGNKSVQSSR